MNKNLVAWVAILANLIFWPALFIFVSLRPDYSHFTNAISELGTWGAPRMWWWNVIGYMVPGALFSIFGWNFGRLVTPRGYIVPVCLTVPALGLVMSGIFPGDLDHMESLTTRLHLAGSMAGLVMLIALLVLATKIRGEWRAFAFLSIFTLLMLVVIFALYQLAPDLVVPRPGLVQRLTFANWMGWYLLAGLLLLAKND